jgi:hypothetical protein
MQMFRGLAAVFCVGVVAPAAWADATGTAGVDTAAHTTVVVEPQQSLWSISGKLLNDPWLWPLLYCDNQGKVGNPEKIAVGQVLNYRTDYTLDEKAAATKLAWEFSPEKVNLQLCPEVKAREVAIQNATPAPTAVPTPAATPSPVPTSEFGKLYLGVGWPDVKLRYSFQEPIDIEFKTAFGSGIQVYSGRVYWTYWSYRGALPLDLTTGLEGGIMNMHDDAGLNGGGADGLVFAGVETPLGKWGRLSVDLGPAYVSLHDNESNVDAWEWVITTGFYIRLF